MRSTGALFSSTLVRAYQGDSSSAVLPSPTSSHDHLLLINDAQLRPSRAGWRRRQGSASSRHHYKTLPS